MCREALKEAKMDILDAYLGKREPISIKQFGGKAEPRLGKSEET